ncbi:CASP-like protein 5B3 [Linum perenne]
MRDFAGTPGTLTALFLRISQCVFAAASITAISTTSSFFNFTAFWAYPLKVAYSFCSYLIASMGLQVIWSFGLALLDAYALLRGKILHNSLLVSLFAVGDWLTHCQQVTATLSLAAASASAGITILLFHDLGHCGLLGECQKYQMAVALAFLSWITIATSSIIMLWLMAEG